jgi:hypothetical protein
MKFFTISLLMIVNIFFTTLAATNIHAQTPGDYGLLTVNDSGDSHDVAPGDRICLDAAGKCTLRAAIEETNALPNGFFVNFTLPSGSVIDLTLGELKITQKVNIIGPGSEKLTVQRSPNAGTPQFRIFHVNLADLSSLPVPVIIRGLTIRNGETASDGGGVFIFYQNIVQMTDVVLTNNRASSGGGIFNAGILYMSRSLVNANLGNGFFGGGISNLGSALSIISNSTLTNNSGASGGAVYNSGSLLLVNNTISHNSATSAGSGVSNAANGTVYVLNTIIGMDTASSSLSGAFNSKGNNLITDARNSTGFTNGVNGDQVSDNNAINPLLGNLSANGGATPTRALLAGSPAIDRGNTCVINGNCGEPFPQIFPMMSDQRKGFYRSVGGAPDVGAYESNSTFSLPKLGLGGVSFSTRFAGAFVILTRAGDGEKFYASMNQFGNYRFNELDAAFYIFEVRSKRANTGYIHHLDLDDFVLPPGAPLTFELANQKIVIEKNEPSEK